MPARVLLFTLLFTTPLVARAGDLFVLLQQRNCPDCFLANVDLVHADLRDADLQRAQLQRANLGQARLDGADLSGADLSFTSLRGASLRGADLTGSRLYGTDLREADLSGARLSYQALEEAHWRGAKGIASDARSHSTLHNSGVEAFQAGRLAEAEQLFGTAITIDPHEPLSWVARGLCRSEQTKDQLAVADFLYAAELYQKLGAEDWAKQLIDAADSVDKRQHASSPSEEGKGLGSQVLQGAMTAFRMLAPIAGKALAPLGLGL